MQQGGRRCAAHARRSALGVNAILPPACCLHLLHRPPLSAPALKHTPVSHPPAQSPAHPTSPVCSRGPPIHGAEGAVKGSLELAQRLGNDTLASVAARRRRLAAAAGGPGGQTLPVLLGADKLWEQGYRGQTVRMGVFDTGIRGDHPHVKNIRWAGERRQKNGLGSGWGRLGLGGEE